MGKLNLIIYILTGIVLFITTYNVGSYLGRTNFGGTLFYLIIAAMLMIVTIVLERECSDTP